MIEGRISAVRRLGAGFGISLAMLALASCEARKETGPDEAAKQEVPEIAPAVPSAVVDPAAVRPLESFPGMDADNDGLVTSAEHAKAAQTMFQMLDADRDGTVSIAEMDAVKSADAAAKPSAAAGQASEKTVAALDSDSDGKLTLAEYVAGSNAMFAEVDANKDERLAKAEWDAAQVVGQAAPAPGAMPGAK